MKLYIFKDTTCKIRDQAIPILFFGILVVVKLHKQKFSSTRFFWLMSAYTSANLYMFAYLLSDLIFSIYHNCKLFGFVRIEPIKNINLSLKLSYLQPPRAQNYLIQPKLSPKSIIDILFYLIIHSLSI